MEITAVMKFPARLQRASVPNAMSRRSSAEIVIENGDKRKFSAETAIPIFSPSSEKNHAATPRSSNTAAASRADRHRVIVKAVRISGSDKRRFLNQVVGPAEFLEGSGSDGGQRANNRVYSELLRGEQPRKNGR